MKCRYFCRLPLDISPVYLTRGISAPPAALIFLCIYIGSTYHALAKPNIFRLLQFLNMSFMPEQHLKYSPLPRMHSPAGTDFVEKELRSSSSRLLQSLNISQKPITLSVLKCETSSCFTDCSAQINLAGSQKRTG